MSRWTPWPRMAVAIVGWATSGCSSGVNVSLGSNGEGGGSASASGTSGASSGEGGGASACALDCSTIQTPPCLAGVCDEATGQCAIVPTASGDPCDDGEFCTVGESCSEGKCEGGVPNTCGEV